MANATFSNEQLVKAWSDASKSDPKGTRRDVVETLMKEMGLQNTDENYRRTYNNVTQRVASLKQLGVNFPELTEGQKGARIKADDIAGFNALLNPAPAPAPATKPEGETSKATAKGRKTETVGA